MTETAGVEVLLVEDDALVRTLLHEALEQAGYSVQAVTNGEDALSRLEGGVGTTKALISDIRLGKGPSGWDVARRGRELIHDLAVVYMTGDSGGEWSSQGVPNSALIIKPFATDQAVTAVSTLLNEAAAKSAL